MSVAFVAHSDQGASLANFSFVAVGEIPRKEELRRFFLGVEGDEMMKPAGSACRFCSCQWCYGRDFSSFVFGSCGGSRLPGVTSCVAFALKEPVSLLGTQLADQRRADEELVASALKLEFFPAGKFFPEYRGGVVEDASLPTSYSWGVGFCYLRLVPGHARHAAARVLGPNCLVTDLIRFISVVGQCSGARFKLMLGKNGLHVECRGVAVGPQCALVNVVRTLMEIVKDRGYHLRIGGEGPQMMEVYLPSVGCVVDGVSRYDWVVVSHALSAMPAIRGHDPVLRLRVLALLGERVLRVVHAAYNMDCTATSELDRLDQAVLARAPLTRAVLLTPFMTSVDTGGVDPTSCGVVRMAFHAVAGLLFQHGGIEAVRCFMDVHSVQVDVER